MEYRGFTLTFVAPRVPLGQAEWHFDGGMIQGTAPTLKACKQRVDELLGAEPLPTPIRFGLIGLLAFTGTALAGGFFAPLLAIQIGRSLIPFFGGSL